jgi:hypothetical protein
MAYRWGSQDKTVPDYQDFILSWKIGWNLPASFWADIYQQYCEEDDCFSPNVVNFITPTSY